MLGCADRARTRRWIKTIDDYHFPVVTLSDKTRARRALHDLRDPEPYWREAQRLRAAHRPFLAAEHQAARTVGRRRSRDHPVIRRLRGRPLLRPARHLASRSRQGTVVQTQRRAEALTAVRHRRDWWDKPWCLGLATGSRSCRRLQGDAAQMADPTRRMLPPLAAVLSPARAPRKPLEAGTHREKLERWFWCAGRSGRPTERTEQQVGEGRGRAAARGWPAATPPETVYVLPLRPAGLARCDAASAFDLPGHDLPASSAMASTRLPHSRPIITGKLMAQEGIDDHHVFPAAYLEREGIASPPCSSTASSTVRSSTAPRTMMISDRAPSDYLAEIRNTPGFPFDCVLASHGLPRCDRTRRSCAMTTMRSWRGGRTRLWERSSTRHGVRRPPISKPTTRIMQ